ncbi:MAG: MogA/MoaB family molybdenum cofactor biosynthesis protein [Planctomycetota bacterium]|nr:MAG: MogA/MoaB family molybdenum cofactor biosynthesis protein [Planctomycetota bacterium]
MPKKKGKGTVFPAAVITVSDKGSKGEREDTSGPALKKFLEERGFGVARYEIVPDEIDAICGILRECSSECSLIVTTGGTGVSPRDVTPDATRQVIETEIPGFGEHMRAVSIRKTPHGIISRALAGTVGQTLIINVPGSKKGALECLEAVFPAIPHTLELIAGRVQDCAEEISKHGEV